jgi:Transglutaminase-like superfamily/Coenzyme PQQ synthesis protein D (PqqD)
MRAGLHSAFTALAPPAPGEGRVLRNLRLLLLRLLLPALVRRHHLADLLVLLDGDPDARAPGADARRILDGLRGRRMTCLHRALAGYAALRARGEEVRFVIGVRPDPGAPRAVIGHAWLELQGEPLGEPEDPRTRWAVALVHPPRAVEKEPRMSSPPRRPDVILTELQDGTGVLLHLGTKFYYALNATGVAAWKLIEAGEAAEPEDLARHLAERFAGVSAEDARRDVEVLLAELRAEDLLPRSG